MRLEELKVMFMDNGAYHKARWLIWPGNILPPFLPPYSPELNPPDKIWWNFKRALSHQLFSSPDHLIAFIAQQVNALDCTAVRSIIGFVYFSPARTLWTIL